jgi:drug/metabolite transporter (DMT)-like permease
VKLAAVVAGLTTLDAFATWAAYRYYDSSRWWIVGCILAFVGTALIFTFGLRYASAGFVMLGWIVTVQAAVMAIDALTEGIRYTPAQLGGVGVAIAGLTFAIMAGGVQPEVK